MTTFRTKQALTLVEVLIFVWVLVLLVSLFLGWYQPSERGHHRNNCLGQLRQIALAAKAYANDDVHNQYFPFVAGTVTAQTIFNETLVKLEYVKDIRVFRCPYDMRLEGIDHSANRLGIGQLSYSILSGTLTKDDGGTDTPILADAQGTYSPHDGKGSNVFFSDGHGIWKSQTTLTAAFFPDINVEGRRWASPAYGDSSKWVPSAMGKRHWQTDGFRQTFRILTGGLVVVFLLGGIWVIQRSRGKKPSESQEESSG